MNNVTKKELDGQLFANNRKILDLIPDVPKDALDQFALDFIGTLAYANRGGGFDQIQAKVKLEAIREMTYDAIRDAAAASPDFKLICLEGVFSALDGRWLKSGRQEFVEKTLLDEMVRHIDNNGPREPIADVLLNGVEALENWSTVSGMGALSADEVERIRMARLALAAPGPQVKKPSASMGV